MAGDSLTNAPGNFISRGVSAHIFHVAEFPVHSVLGVAGGDWIMSVGGRTRWKTQQVHAETALVVQMGAWILLQGFERPSGHADEIDVRCFGSIGGQLDRLRTFHNLRVHDLPVEAGQFTRRRLRLSCLDHDGMQDDRDAQ